MTKAFEVEERTFPWHSNGWSLIKALWRDIEDETHHARERFNFPGCHLEIDVHNRSYWLSVITEEIGKLCQCVNKLQISRDETVRDGWQIEGYHRIITSLSLLRRLAENWKNLPDK